MQFRTFILILVIAAAAEIVVADSTLADLAERNQLQDLAAMIAQNIDVNAAQVDGMTALHWAAWHENTDAVRALLNATADPNIANRYNVTPLSLACANGNAAIVELLLNAGADVHTTLEGGESVLMTAARTGQLQPVAMLLENGASINLKDQQGQTALMWAAAEGHADVVKALLKAGADHNISLKSDFTALYFAAREGHSEAAMALIKAGADVDGIMQPAKTNGKSVRKGTSALMLAVENGHFEMAAALLNAGADPNDQRSGYTVLHALTWVRKPNRGDGPDGEPPPQGTGNMTSLQFVRRLMESGADINAQLLQGESGRGRLNQTGATPFLMAADTADLPLMKLLMELGADPHIPNADGCTALMAAAGIGTMAPGEEAGTEEESLAATLFLLEQGFDINAVDRNGETTMHGAAYASFPLMAEFLVSHGADIKVWHAQNKYGWTPLLIAQGHRPGNFKPAAATMAALEKVMLANGVQPTEAKPFSGGDEYSKKKAAGKPKK